MDDGLAAITVLILLFDHSGSVARRTFPDDCVTIMIPVTVSVVIMSFADRHASTHRTCVDSNLIREGGRRNGANHGGNKQGLPHSHSPKLFDRRKCGQRSFVPLELGDQLRFDE
jgi:hypothetical protein